LRICIDIEANAKEPEKVTKIWCIVSKDIDTGELHVHHPYLSLDEAESFRVFARKVNLWVGHNILGYDLPVLVRLLGIHYVVEDCIDTLILSRLTNYPRSSHSLESYGEEFGLSKIEVQDQTFFSQWSQELEDYCVRDVEITLLLWKHFASYLADASQHAAIRLEHAFQLVCNNLHDNGFGFNVTTAKSLLAKMEVEISKLDEDIKKFPPKFVVIREITPRATKFGTINQINIPKELRHKISEYKVGVPFTYGHWVEFNPNSLKQTIDLLWEAGWKPIDKTKGNLRNKDVDKDDRFDIYGWKVNEINLGTLPTKAPPAAKTLAKRIMYESRRRTLTEWLSLVGALDARIHGKFQAIGAWTHRMAHQAPNMANIPNEKDISGNIKLLGGEMRSLFCTPKNRLLVGTDAKGIQLRIFAHYINDREFTDAVVNGDPHTLNRNIMGELCHTRAAAKRFIFAMLLGAGLGKLAEILECNREQANTALSRIMERYTGFRLLKETIIPEDAYKGYFIGLDGRKVRIPGDTESKRRHLAMSGYLQNGETVVMKKATLKWLNQLKSEPELIRLKERYYPSSSIFQLVNLVHDEWQTECINNMDVALKIAETQHRSLVEVGEELKLNCPLAGSYQTDDGKYTIGLNWKTTH